MFAKYAECLISSRSSRIWDEFAYLALHILIAERGVAEHKAGRRDDEEQVQNQHGQRFTGTTMLISNKAMTIVMYRLGSLQEALLQGADASTTLT